MKAWASSFSLNLPIWGDSVRGIQEVDLTEENKTDIEKPFLNITLKGSSNPGDAVA